MPLHKLRVMNLSHSTHLTKSPNFAEVPNLEKLILEGCIGLVKLHPSIGDLRRLIFLNLGACKILKSLPIECIQLESLEILILSGCSMIDKLPEDVGVLDRLKVLRADRTAIRQFPSSIVLLEKLEIMSFDGSGGTTSNSWRSIFLSLFVRRQRENSMSLKLPDLSRFKYLRELNFRYCNIKYIPLDIFSLHSLEDLDLSGNHFESLPASMNQLKLLRIRLSNCKRLQELPELSSQIQFIDASGCKSLRTILNPSIYQNISEFDFRNCLKLVENERSTILQDQFIRKQFLVGTRECFCVLFPGSEISEWFSHQSMGTSVSINFPPLWYNPRWWGFALSFAVEPEKGIIIFRASFHVGENHFRWPSTGFFKGFSGVFIVYVPKHIDSAWEQLFNKESGIITVSFEETHEQAPSRCVKKCGIRLIYMDDDDAANTSKTSFQEDHPNNRRLGQSIDPVDHIEVLNHEAGPSGSTKL